MVIYPKSTPVTREPWVQPINTKYVVIFSKSTPVTRVPWVQPINTYYVIISPKSSPVPWVQPINTKYMVIFSKSTSVTRVHPGCRKTHKKSVKIIDWAVLSKQSKKYLSLSWVLIWNCWIMRRTCNPYGSLGTPGTTYIYIILGPPPNRNLLKSWRNSSHLDLLAPPQLKKTCIEGFLCSIACNAAEEIVLLFGLSRFASVWRASLYINWGTELKMWLSLGLNRYISEVAWILRFLLRFGDRFDG